ncbi:MAG: mandelate racemase/muconate lactonizing enzyme family protein [Acidobacteriia bacterium]|nr:mandelate racemase/muconate lactonizing enzyme family protein [Terriglobia bacterium]
MKAMLNRRSFFRAAVGTTLLGSTASFAPLRSAAASIGLPLRITDIETLILRDPPERKPEDQFVSMTPLGATTGGVGLWNRLERAETVRQGGYRQTLLVKVTTDQGVVGWGESHAVMTPRVVQTVIADMFRPILLGQDARQIEALWEKMYSTQRLRGYGSGYYTRAMAGIDIALWDIVGRAAGMPVYQLLGGKFRDSIPTYQGVGGGPPEEVRDNAQALLERGFPNQKMSLAKGRGEQARDVNRVFAAAEALLGKGQILVDSLAGYTLAEATRVGRKLDEIENLGWWEDVLMPEDYGAYAILADRMDVPICAGEQYSNRFQFRDLFEDRACDIVNPDTSRVGITETKRIAIMADAYNILFAPHSSMGSAPYRASAIHLCAATPNAVILEGGESYVRAFGNAVLSVPLPYKPGHVEVPEGPGLGFEFDEKELSKLVVG